VHPRRDDHGVRAQRPRLPAAHRGAHAAGLGLVARGEHHPSADDDRATPQPRVVALLDRRVERVEVRVQYRRIGARHAVRSETHEHMFAHAPADVKTVDP
jgi:hypothetical protein